MDHRKVAEEILEALGGKENLAAGAHCATRLRLVLHDEQKVDQARLDNMEAVKGTFSTGGQFQVILGAGTVNTVFSHFAKLAGIEEMSTNDVKEAGKTKLNPIQKFVKTLSDVFVPIIPAIVAGGLLMGLNNILTSQNLFGPQSLVQMFPNIGDLTNLINIFANAPFVFLPILIGFSAAKKFGGNPFLGAAMAMIMVHPELLNGYSYGEAVAKGNIPQWNIFGFHIDKVGYQGTVLPVLVVSYLLSIVEKWLRKIIPSFLDNLLTPLLTIFITGILTFTFVGPLMRLAGNLLTEGLVWLYDTTGLVGGAIFGLVYSPIVITGMHHSFIAVETQLLAEVAKTGGTFIFPVACMANIAQGAATLAVLLVTKNKKLKSIASAAGISALLGITEPAMFGINLKLKYPFIAAIAGASISSAYIMMEKVLSVALGPAGVPGLLAIRPQSTVSFIIGMVLSFAISFIVTLVWARKKGAEESTEA